MTCDEHDKQRNKPPFFVSILLFLFTMSFSFLFLFYIFFFFLLKKPQALCVACTASMGMIFMTNIIYLLRFGI
jgi:Sec-independent protein secretion pathway component TatC